MIIDGHTDVLYALMRERRKFSEESQIGHVDLPRLRKGNVLAAFFAIFPANNDFSIFRGIDLWFQLIENDDNQLYQIKNLNDLEICKNTNKIGAILHFEGSGGIDTEFHCLRNYYRLGLRSMGLSWSNFNRFATGVSIFEDPGFERGLTELGKELVQEMNKLGIIVDVSHLNTKSFWDVNEITSKPFIASHSNASEICNHLRNLNDDQIRAINEIGGTIGINFATSFLSSTLKKEEIGLDIIKNHMDHIINVGSVNCVSLGSDFDGATVPDSMKDVSYYPKLIEFLEQYYSKEEIEKITHKNFVRVMKNCWN